MQKNSKCMTEILHPQRVGGLGLVAQLVRASSRYGKVVGLIPGQAHTRVNQ